MRFYASSIARTNSLRACAARIISASAGTLTVVPKTPSAGTLSLASWAMSLRFWWHSLTSAGEPTPAMSGNDVGVKKSTGKPQKTLLLQGNEYITKVQQRSGANLDGLIFFTNTGRTHTFGSQTVRALIGVRGNALGAFCTRRSHCVLPPIQRCLCADLTFRLNIESIVGPMRKCRLLSKYRRSRCVTRSSHFLSARGALSVSALDNPNFHLNLTLRTGS